jgi:hypothetical protein
VADIFISYTSSDRNWAFWIGQKLIKLGHEPHVDEWEIPAGGNIAKWMEERHRDADHILCVIMAAQWAAASRRPNFVLPVFIEDCEAPTLLAPFKRCNLFGLSGDDARKTLASYLAPAGVLAGAASVQAASFRSYVPSQLVESNVPRFGNPLSIPTNYIPL